MNFSRWNPRTWNPGSMLILGLFAGCGIAAWTAAGSHSGFRPGARRQPHHTRSGRGPRLPVPDDPEFRSNAPGKCKICGMTLRAGIPEPTEFPMDFTIGLRSLSESGAKETMTFNRQRSGKRQAGKTISNRPPKLFHMFVVSQDFKYFIHDHPVFGDDSNFVTTSRSHGRACIVCSAIFVRTVRRVSSTPKLSSCRVLSNSAKLSATTARRRPMGQKNGAPVAIPGRRKAMGHHHNRAAGTHLGYRDPDFPAPR